MDSNVNFLDDLVKRCQTRGYHFAEASFQCIDHYRVSFEFDETAIEEVKNRFLFIRIVDDKWISSANFAFSDIESIDSIIDLTVKNSRSFERNKIGLLIDRGVGCVTDSNVQWPELKNIQPNNLFNWLKHEADLIAEEIDRPVVSMAYEVETSENFYRNSRGKTGGYLVCRSTLNGAIDNSEAGALNNLAPFSINNLKPFTTIAPAICTGDFKSDLSNLQSRELIKLEGKSGFINTAVAGIINGFANSFNVEFILAGNSFIKLADINRQVFDSSISVVDNPLSKDKGKIYFPFDNEGTMARKKYLVKNGKINDLLSDLERSIRIEGVSAGNCYRGGSDIKFKIISSNVVLQLEKPGKNDNGVENIVDELGFQSMFDVGSGRVKGIAKGRKISGNDVKRVNFSLDFSIVDFFKNISGAHSYEWINGNYVPTINTVI